MEFFQVTVGIYDILAILVPGILVVCVVWIAAAGWNAFSNTVRELRWPSAGLLLLVSYSVGTMNQELASLLIRSLRSPQVFTQPRSDFWESERSILAKEAIARELGREVSDVDIAFNYCLTRIHGRFPKRDLFLAVSDLCRGFLVVAAVGIAAILRLARDLGKKRSEVIGLFVAGLVLLSLLGYLSWTRMMFFRRLSEVPVFHAYLAVAAEAQLEKR